MPVRGVSTLAEAAFLVHLALLHFADEIGRVPDGIVDGLADGRITLRVETSPARRRVLVVRVRGLVIANIDTSIAGSDLCATAARHRHSVTGDLAS